MREPCPKGQESFAFALGELGLRDSIRASWHLLTCPRCRRETKRMRRVSSTLATSFGRQSLVVAVKPMAVKAGWAVVGLVASIGLYAAGQQAVQAAMATRDRPQIRQATFSEDDRADRERRLKNATQ